MHPAKFINGKNVLGFFFHYKSFFFPENAHSSIFVRFFSLFLCGIVSGLWVCCERLGAVKVKVPVLSPAVVSGSKRDTQKVVALSKMYRSRTDQLDP